MSSFEEALVFVLEREGGYVDHPDDPGGETNLGISHRAYPYLDIPNLTREDVAPIYRKDYWDRVLGDGMPAPVALIMFDCAVNCGVNRAARILQKQIGAKIDGLVGRDTLAKSNSAYEKDPQGMVAKLCDARLRFYKSLRKSAFIRGWTNRVRDVEVEANKLIG